MWSGYLAGASERRMRQAFTDHGVTLEVHHVPGHAYVRHLRRLVDAVRPERVIPIHTAEPSRYASLFPRVEAHANRAWWSA
jgi:ribonuclease J